MEIGFGTGLNSPFYQAIDRVYALEPNTDVFHLAQQRILDVPFHVKHIQSGAEKLPFANESIDHLVSTWTLCSIADLETALHEIYRVLKPQSTFHLVEHVAYNDQSKLRTLQNLLTPIQKVIADGCHLNRDIEAELAKASFHCVEKHYFDANDIPKIGRRMLFARAQKITAK